MCNNEEKEADNGLQDQRVWSPEECADIFSQRFVNPFSYKPAVATTKEVIATTDDGLKKKKKGQKI